MTKIELMKQNLITKRETILGTVAYLQNLRAEYKEMKIELAKEQAEAKVFNAFVKEQKAKQKELKKQDRIAKLKAKLLALETPKVGIKAKKASKKPGPVTVIKPETV